MTTHLDDLDKTFGPKWLKDKETWILSNIFQLGFNTKGDPPRIGDRVGSWTVIGTWVNKRGTLKAYKVQCDCGTIVEYMKVDKLKFGSSLRCLGCYDAPVKGSNNRRFFFEQYARKDARALYILWRHMNDDSRVFPNSSTFYKPWKTDLKAFGDYIIKLPRFSQYRDQEIKHGHPDCLTPDRHPDTLSGYIPGNIRFATTKEQMRNRKDNLFIEFQGSDILLIEFIEILLGSSYSESKVLFFIRRRYKEGKSASEIIELLANKVFWDCESVKVHFFQWYNDNDNAHRRA